MYKFCSYENGVLTIGMPREVDHHVAGEMRMEADHMIDAYPVRRIVFDLAETEFMDSSGIGVVIGRAKNIGYRGGSASAINMSDRVAKIFHLSGLSGMVETECVASMRRGGDRYDIFK